MRLVIAEKPSVAMNLAKVLGAGARRDGYTEGSGWLADTILTLLRCPEKYRRMQQAAVETARAYSEELVAERAESYYRSVEGRKLWSNQMQRNFTY